MSELDKPIADTPRVSVTLSISLDSSSPEPTTQHRCRLIVVIMVLCISVYFYGHILTNLSTFSTKTIKAVSTESLRSTETSQPRPPCGESSSACPSPEASWEQPSRPALTSASPEGTSLPTQTIRPLPEHHRPSHRGNRPDNQPLGAAGLQDPPGSGSGGLHVDNPRLHL